MPKPSKHKAVQVQIHACAHELKWSFVSREEAESQRDFAAVKYGKRALSCRFWES